MISEKWLELCDLTDILEKVEEERTHMLFIHLEKMCLMHLNILNHVKPKLLL